MKTTQLLTLALVLTAGILFIPSCEKTGNELPDDFIVAVSEDSNDPGAKIAYHTPNNTGFSLLYSPKALGQEVWMGQTELSYKLWKEVFDWAGENGYLIDSDGQTGSDDAFSADHPVTMICWYDAVVWCNALTELYNLHNGDRPDYSYVYTVDGAPIRNSEIRNSEFDRMTFDAQATGFRIPTNDEWLAAASYPDTPENYASGASGHYDDEAATTAVGWYQANANRQSHPVAQLQANQLGIFDMSGNVKEIMYDLLDKYSSKSNNRGGAWNSNPEMLAVSATHPMEEHSSSYSMGFRLTRTLGDDSHEDIGTLN